MKKRTWDFPLLCLESLSGKGLSITQNTEAMKDKIDTVDYIKKSACSAADGMRPSSFPPPSSPLLSSLCPSQYWV
jgi:hypothetical protein